ncbi:MAG: hypothetical protein DRR19_19875 [Candidatus Parabeggiatoa sp. nov. 1]|nr:MAG: hypothetical protein DRR19_19875 [Gammaproteobacteria bacterium]HEC85887.1 hypothetical protein [Thioploca sp.]
MCWLISTGASDNDAFLTQSSLEKKAQSQHPTQTLNTIKLRATTRDCPYEPSLKVGAILYGCHNEKA